ncbi:MAG: VPLPA-CTERM sorting domain-containing protein [Pseudomonadales bacterium]|nr:VPLPA-CTERM sorting domain-containing protein [Pseudomonadales bacterium]
MNFKAKVLTAAVALASMSGVAEAKWLAGLQEDGFTGGGEILLLAWDETRNVSVIQDLGGDYIEFWDNFNNTAYTFNETLDPLFGSTFAASAQGDVRYSLVSLNTGLNTVDEWNEPARFSNGIMVTSNAAAPTLERRPAGSYDQSKNNIQNGTVIEISDHSSTFADNNAYFGDATTAPYAGSDFVWGRNIGTATLFDTSATSDESMYFWAFTQKMEVADANVGLLPAQDLKAAGQWSLDLANNTIAYSAVPLPAALWLFVSGLLGLGAVSRRKNA